MIVFYHKRRDLLREWFRRMTDFLEFHHSMPIEKAQETLRSDFAVLAHNADSEVTHRAPLLSQNSSSGSPDALDVKRITRAMVAPSSVAKAHEVEWNTLRELSRGFQHPYAAGSPSETVFRLRFCRRHALV